MTEGLRLEKANGIARIIVDRPEACNAINPEIVGALARFLQGVATDSTIRAVLIAGGGGHFISGGDIRDMAQYLTLAPEQLGAVFEQHMIASAPLWTMMERMPQPVVCKIIGFAAGSALSFVAGADIAVAAESARFVAGQQALGLPADGASSWHLARKLGVRKAKAMAYLGEVLNAQEALAAGLITKVAPDAKLDDTVEAILERLCNSSRLALAETKALLNGASDKSLGEQIILEATALGRCAAAPDFQEGVAAFLGKRKPQFRD